MEESSENPYDDVARVLAQLNTEVVGKILRGEDTLDDDLDKITLIAEKCRKRALVILGEANENDGAILEDEGATIAGLPTVTAILDEYEVLRDIRNELIRSFSLRTKDLLEMQKGTAIKDTTTGIATIDMVLTPPGIKQQPIQPGVGSFTKEFQERLAMLQIILLDLGIDPREKDNVSITIGHVSNDMVRDVSYVSVFIPQLERLVEICNEVGNRSFVWNTNDRKDILIYGAMTKEQKDEVLVKNPSAGSALIMRQEWENEIRLLLINKVERVATIGGIEKVLTRTRNRVRSNDEWITEVEKWREKHGKENPLKKASLVGSWLNKARRILRDGGFTVEQIARLRAMGIEDAKAKKTVDEWITELETWRKEHPNEWPSHETSLGMWLQQARIKLRDGGFTAEQIARLRAMDVEDAKIKTEISKTTDGWITELETWRKEHLNEWPSLKTPLGKWLGKARAILRDGGFNSDQTARLRAMGVEDAKIKTDVSKIIDGWITELETWRKEHPNEWPSLKTPLGKWLGKARAILRDGGFNSDQTARLRSMGVEDAKAKKTVDEWITELETWRKEHPNEWPPQKSSLNFWLQQARIKIRDGGFNSDQTARLRSMGVEDAKKQKLKN